MYSRVRSHTRLLGAVLLLGSLALLAAACTSEAASEDPTPAASPTTPAVATGAAATPTEIKTATPVNTPTAVATATTVATPSPGQQTGIRVVDRVLTAVQDKNVMQLESLAYLEGLACTSAAGLGGPPGCLPGEAPGTIVHVLFTSSCDGHYIRRDQVGQLMGRFLEDKGKLAGVYRHNGSTFPPSQYVLVYSFDTPYGSLARVLFVSDTGIVGVTFGCGTSAKEFVEVTGLKDAILLPGG